MSENSALDAFNWSKALDELSYAEGKPEVSGVLKLLPEDFKVTELMEVVPTGDGEHYWLDVTKIKCNTEQVAKALARFASVSPRDVGYSGMKDLFAETRQWFSVWKPKGGQPAWDEFKLEGVTVNNVLKHSRKLKRGTHRANRFEIVIRDLGGDVAELESRLNNVQKQGVPNYFGAQRFGRNVENMQHVMQLFLGEKKFKNRHLNGILLSSARSWLFNQVVSARVAEGSWQQLKDKEPANLHSSNSVFVSTGTVQDNERLNGFDIHPTAPMWGAGLDQSMSDCDLFSWEQSIMAPFSQLQSGLEQARLDYQRRAIRSIATDLSWSVDDSTLSLSFELIRGQFATSILRELVNV